MTEVLPNCFTTDRKINHHLSVGGNTWLYLYCASCGKPGGSVMEVDVPDMENFAFYLCPPCAEKYGDLPPELFMIPDEVFWKKVHDAQMEKYGRLLTPEEVARELDDSSSMLSKLKHGG